MEITQSDMLVWKSKLVDMLKFIQDVCAANGLRYFCVSGTAIGAVRHRGFIPWDDDIDIVMPRPDYEKLKSIWNSVANGNYEFLSYDNTVGYFYTHSKISSASTSLIELDSQNYIEGIYIDVFPLDGCSNDFADFKKDMDYFRSLYLKLQVICEPMNGTVLKGIFRMLKKKNLYFLRYLPYYFIRPLLSRCSLERKLALFVDKHKYETSDYVAAYSGSYKYKEYVPKKWFGKGTKARFENLEVVIPEHYDEMLKHFYGNYMEVPPKDKQVSHHFVSYYTLNKRLSLNEARKYIK